MEIVANIEGIGTSELNAEEHFSSSSILNCCTEKKQWVMRGQLSSTLDRVFPTASFSTNHIQVSKVGEWLDRSVKWTCRGGSCSNKKEKL
jgi:hypothetical protein